MAIFGWAAKDPSDIMDYEADWSALLRTSETIATSAFTMPTGLTMASESNTTTTSTVWIGAGSTVGSYEVACTITTNQGRTLQRSWSLMVAQL